MSDIEAIYRAVVEGNAAGAKAGVTAALAAGVGAETVLKEGLIAAMGEVGRLFEANEYFVPEMLVSARAMQAGLNLLKPYLAEAGAPSAGRVAIGTVKGDLHDIGKNLVAMMLEGAGFEVIDLGTDVSPERFVAAVRQYQPQIIGMSALLTTTMPAMAATTQALREAGLREQVKVMVGGAPVTEEYAQRIGADGFARDAASAVRLARSLVDGH
jgi:5-methyltetrahydrofolate--homocysteine methyltransferase